MEQNTLLWLAPTLAGMFAWGIAQGLVKKYVGEVPPARFCLFYAVAVGVVSVIVCFTFSNEDRPPVFAEEGRTFLMFGMLAYVLDGIAWILYYESIVAGPISIVGTLSAAYPALTVLFARIFLAEQLVTAQYAGVFAVIAGCLLLAYSPPDPQAKVLQKRWIPLAAGALLIWGINGVIIKYAYALPNAHEGNMFLFIAAGGALTLGVYGLIKGRSGGGGSSSAEWTRAFIPMATMAIGGALVAFAYKKGPASLVTPISGAYPVITLAFAGFLLKERPAGLHWIGIVAIFIGLGCVTSVEWWPVVMG
jgi:drug/metabolite transporter (DMT)-like permease